MGPVVTHLVAALRALAQPVDRALALDHLIKAWRSDYRRPELAELVEALSAEAARGFARLEPTLGDSDFHAAWIARAVTATSLELDHLTPGLFRGPLGRRIRERFDLLAPFADDPRMCSCFARMILEPPVMAASNFSLWTQLFAKLRAAPDIRLRPVLEQRLRDPGGSSQFWPMLQQRSLDLLARLPRELPALDPEAGERIAELHARIATLRKGPPAKARARGPAENLEAELLAAIHAHPDALEHRMVWADALLSRGDPRGEFVQLQLARLATGAPPCKRERKLLKRHELSWTGELGAVLERKSLVFEAGFLTRGEVLFDSATERELLRCPAWATLRELDCDDPELFVQPQLRGLERAGGFAFPALRRLLEHEGPPSSLRALGPIFVDQLPPFELDHLRAAPASWLAEVHSLWLHADGHDLRRQAGDFDWIFALPLGQRIRSLRISGFPYMSYDSRKPDWRAWAQTFIESERWQGLERLRLDMHRLGYEFIRTPEGPRLRVWHDYTGSVTEYRRREATAVLQALGPHFTSLEFVGVHGQAARHEGLAVLAASAGFERFDHAHEAGASRVGHGVWRRLHGLLARQHKSAKRLSRSQRQTTTQAPAKSKVRARRQRLAATGSQIRQQACAPDLAPSPALTGARWLEFDAQGGLLCLAERGVFELELSSLRPRWTLSAQSSFVALAHDPGRGWLWLGSSRGETSIWDLGAKRELARARFHRNQITALALASERDLLLSCDHDAKLIAWSAPAPATSGSGSEPRTSAMIPRSTHLLGEHATALALAPDGQTLAVLTAGGELSLRSLDKLDEPQFIGRVGARPCVLGWAPTGDHLIATLAHGGLVVWDPEGVELTRLSLHSRKITAACWTPRGDLITASDAIHVTARESGERLLSLQPSDGRISALAVSKNGLQLAVAAHSGVSLWSLVDGTVLARSPSVA